MRYILLFLLLLSLPAHSATLSGTVSGLALGKTFVLTSGKFSKTIRANGPYSMTDGGPVKIGIQPSGQQCIVAVTDVTCENSYTVSGSVSGATASLTLRLNDTVSLIVASGATSYRFATSLVSGSVYYVTVGIQPIGQSCSVSNSSGTISTSNITNANVTCLSVYTVSGSISGLTSSGLILKMNSSSKIIASGATSFAFSTQLTSGSPYNVSITSQPSGLICTVINPSGVIASSNITNVSVPCVTPTYTVGGSVTGLNGSLTLVNNGIDSKTVTSDGSYTFNNPLTTGTPYAVTINTQPVGQSCSLSNNSGVIATTNVANVLAACITISGTASLNWTQPTQNTDGTILTDLAGYKLYYGTDPNNLTNTIDIPNGNTLSYTIQGLTAGTLYYFNMSSYNTSNVEGPRTNNASGNASPSI